MMSFLEKVDKEVIHKISAAFPTCSRLALFVVFFGFGVLKLFDASPANPLVENLLQKTLPFLTFNQFIIILGVWEMMIGVAFLIPHLERLAIFLLVPHMITTVMPLILLPTVTWNPFPVPTLEGQYIIKNLVIIALAMGIASQLKPWQFKK
ncbi:MAG: hypothetical protein G01um101419_178 [Parcubacteria group bacterium Gr01-1014_19]|nr:MAG: hypothetical protein G01um101419_178 [Parcubacteria group bacterium Gr01-1014_19]